MIRPTPEVTKALAASVRQYPVIAEWLQEWRMHELEQLPSVAQNTALAQGRCQILSELTKYIEQSPEIAAKSQ
jgi:hypothetical protein